MPFPLFWGAALLLSGREVLAGQEEDEKEEQRKLGLIDAEAQRQVDIDAIDIGIDNQSVSNQFDSSQIQAMHKQFQTAQGLLKSSNPKLVSMGATMISDLHGAVRGNIQQNENEFRADQVRKNEAEVLAAGAGKADNEKRFDRELTMNKQLLTDLKPMREAEVGYSKILNALDNNDFTSSQVALVAMIQSIDGSVVRSEELANYQSTNGGLNFLINAINKVEGKDFTEETKTSIRNASAALINAERARGMAIAETYQSRASAFSLTPDRVMAGVDQNLFTKAAINREAQIEEQKRADFVEQQITDNTQFEEVEEGLLEQGLGAIGRGAQSILAGAGRVVRGVKLVTNERGDLFEQDEQGNKTIIKVNKRFVDSSGRVMVLIDLGEGRTMWRQVGQEKGSTVSRIQQEDPSLISNFIEGK
jgi:hypothetical protein